MINYDSIPERVREALDRYVHRHLPTGGFLRCVLANDLRGAVGRADEECLAALHSIVGWIVNEAPDDCYGSYAAVDAWCRKQFY